MNLLKIENIKIADLREYAQNAKLHNEKQVKQIAESIKEFGFNNPILIDEVGEIIAGHGRLMAARELGLETVPVIRLSHLSAAQKRLYRIADNKIAENGGWNTDLLKLEISELETIVGDLDLDLSITGFESLDLDVMFHADDKSQKEKKADEKANTVPFISDDEIVTKPGDIWLLGQHKIICGNSLESETFEKLMGDARADMCLQDPPYNVKISGHVCGNGAVQHKEFLMASGEMSQDEFTQFLRKNFELCKQFSRAVSLNYNFMDWRHIREICDAGHAVFSDFINMCVWQKHNGGMGSLYRSQHELCFIFRNGKESHINNVELGKNGRYRTNVWSYAGVTSPANKGDLKMHPTVKPVEMLKDAILDVTSRGDVVLDSFLGSGSTLVAAHQSKRICYGIELDPLYIDTTIRRFQTLFKIDAVHEASGKTYSELLNEKRGGENV